MKNAIAREGHFAIIFKETFARIPGIGDLAAFFSSYMSKLKQELISEQHIAGFLYPILIGFP